MNTSSTRAKQAGRGHVVMSRCQLYFLVVYSNTWRVGSNVMMSNTLQQGSHQSDTLGYIRAHSWQSYLL